jgi:hypothetical protein
VSSVVEIAAARVVARMTATPQTVRGHCEEAAEKAESVVCPATAKEGVMPAIVLDDEQPHEESGGRNREQKG